MHIHVFNVIGTCTFKKTNPDQPMLEKSISDIHNNMLTVNWPLSFEL